MTINYVPPNVRAYLIAGSLKFVKISAALSEAMLAIFLANISC